jgi:hypothetical protein
MSGTVYKKTTQYKPQLFLLNVIHSIQSIQTNQHDTIRNQWSQSWNKYQRSDTKQSRSYHVNFRWLWIIEV